MPLTLFLIGNYYQPGPSSARHPAVAFHTGGPDNRLDASGNLLESADGRRLGDRDILDRRRGGMLVDEPFASPNDPGDSADAAYDRVLQSAGAVLPRRDDADRRVVESVRRGEGMHIDSPDQVGGWPGLDAERPAQDTDQDGMPDAWEGEHGLDPNANRDGAADEDGDGYTNLEEFLNATDPNESEHD